MHATTSAARLAILPAGVMRFVISHQPDAPPQRLKNNLRHQEVKICRLACHRLTERHRELIQVSSTTISKPVMERRDNLTMNRSRWNPVRELEAYSQRLHNLLSNRSAQRRRADEPISVPDWTPPVDVVETDEELSLHVDVPGVSKWDLRVTIDDGVLFVQGERKQPPAQTGQKIHRCERSCGRFFRSFTLPESIEPWKVHSELREGVLHVHLPKSRYSKAGAVHVTVA